MKERKNNNKQTKHQQQRVNDVCALCAVCLLGAREKVPTSMYTNVQTRSRKRNAECGRRGRGGRARGEDVDEAR